MQLGRDKLGKGSIPTVFGCQWAISLRHLQEIPQTNLFMFLFLLGLFSEDVLKIELISFQRPLIIPYSMHILKISSKYVAQGVVPLFNC